MVSGRQDKGTPCLSEKNKKTQMTGTPDRERQGDVALGGQEAVHASCRDAFCCEVYRGY